MSFKRIFATLFIISFAGFFVYTLNIKQVNPESIFLTDQGIKEYKNFKERYPELGSVVIYKSFESKSENYFQLEKLGHKIEQMCEDECYVIYPHQLYKSRDEFLIRLKEGKLLENKLVTKNAMALTVFEAEEKSGVLKKVVKSVQEEKGISIVGHEYTNYLLDNASRLVQERLFPIMFALSFIILLIIVKNFKNTVFLFLPSVFSSLLCLTTIKLFFETMNMVTAIIPLITFVITLSIGQHLYFTAKDGGD